MKVFARSPMSWCIANDFNQCAFSAAAGKITVVFSDMKAISYLEGLVISANS
jgi:hypothetical protein